MYSRGQEPICGEMVPVLHTATRPEVPGQPLPERCLHVERGRSRVGYGGSDVLEPLLDVSHWTTMGRAWSPICLFDSFYGLKSNKFSSPRHAIVKDSYGLVQILLFKASLRDSEWRCTYNFRTAVHCFQAKCTWYLEILCTHLLMLHAVHACTQKQNAATLNPASSASTRSVDLR